VHRARQRGQDAAKRAPVPRFTGRPSGL